MDINFERNLNGKVALITGAAQRLGAMTARFLHHYGANIIIHYRHSEKPARTLCDALNKKRKNSAHLVQADLNQPHIAEKIIDSALVFWQRLDVLINNASSFYPTPVQQADAKITQQQWQDLMNSNLKAPYFLSLAAYPHLAKHQGCIVNMVDIHAWRPMREHSIYNMAKAALHMQVKTLACELGPAVRVNGIAPGAILWPQQQDMDVAQKQEIIQRTCLQRRGSAEDIARAILFLVKDADYITAQTLAVDGGRSVVL